MNSVSAQYRAHLPMLPAFQGFGQDSLALTAFRYYGPQVSSQNHHRCPQWGDAHIQILWLSSRNIFSHSTPQRCEAVGGKHKE